MKRKDDQIPMFSNQSRLLEHESISLSLSLSLSLSVHVLILNTMHTWVLYISWSETIICIYLNYSALSYATHTFYISPQCQASFKSREIYINIHVKTTQEKEKKNKKKRNISSILKILQFFFLDSNIETN